MQMKEILMNMRSNNLTKVADKKYYIHIYSGGMQGNIKREDETVLIRFIVNSNQILFAFSKKDVPTEFDYKNYSISLDADVNEIQKISHENATELYTVLVNLRNN